MIQIARTTVRKPYRSIKIWWLATAFLSGLSLAMFAEELIQRAQDNRLHFSAPRVHFLSGRPLEHLHNAAPVPFDIQVTVWSGTHDNVFRKSAARFIISYDLFEDSFSVSKIVPQKQGPAQSKTSRSMTAVQAEAWCLEEMTQDMSGINPTQPLWTRVDIRAEDEKEARLFGRDSVSASGISLTGLIEKLSLPPKTAQPHWTLEAGPITWDQLRRGG
jgi:hypothetical protein